MSQVPQNITVRCPKCGVSLLISPRYRNMKCGQCGTVFATARALPAGQGAGQTKPKAKAGQPAVWVGVLIGASALIVAVLGGGFLVSRMLLAVPETETVEAASEPAEDAVVQIDIKDLPQRATKNPVLSDNVQLEIGDTVNVLKSPASGAGEDSGNTPGAENSVSGGNGPDADTSGQSGNSDLSDHGTNSVSDRTDTTNTSQSSSSEPASSSDTLSYSSSKEDTQHSSNATDTGGSSGNNGGSGGSSYESRSSDQTSNGSSGNSQTQTQSSHSQTTNSSSDSGRNESTDNSSRTESREESSSSESHNDSRSSETESESQGIGDSGSSESSGNSSSEESSSSSSSIRPEIKDVIDAYVAAQKEYSETYDSSPTSRKLTLYTTVIDAYKRFTRLGRSGDLNADEQQYYNEAEEKVSQMYD